MVKGLIYNMYLEDKMEEECGVFGIYSKDDLDVATITYYGLYALQHRGQESGGIAVSNKTNITVEKGMGLVSEIFDENKLNKLKGSIAIGHVRYSTAGESSILNAQPLLSEFKLGSIAMAHNGNLVNADIIRGLLEDAGCIFQTSIDSEVIINLMARAYKKGIEKALLDAVQAIKGSYAIVILTEDKLIGIRDPHGIRPLCIGKIGNSYILSSESCALDSVGGEFIRDVEPGEMVIIDEDGLRGVKYQEKTSCKTCAFEYIYFARPDSVIDGIDVYQSRINAGYELYKEYPIEADIVVGVPDSGLVAAMGFSKASGIPYGMGFIKNRYVGRTFITPSQEMREKAVSVKLNALKVNIQGKRVVLVDDSIVRGTTSRKLITLLKKAGAKEVHFRVAAPAVKYPCYFGIDTPHRQGLIGARMSEKEIKEELDCDSLGYLSIKGLLNSLEKEEGFCLGCFDGVYPVSAPVDVSKEDI